LLALLVQTCKYTDTCGPCAAPELSFGSPGESILPGFDKSKKKDAPSLALKNFKNASKKGQVSETPIGSPRQLQMAAKLAALNAILEQKRLAKEREECEQRGEVWESSAATSHTNHPPAEAGKGEGEGGEEEEEEEDPLHSQMTAVSNLLMAAASFKEGRIYT
jgi:hypothetical protein